MVLILSVEQMNENFEKNEFFQQLPEETKEKIVSALSSLETKSQDRPYKKHGNIPL